MYGTDGLEIPRLVPKVDDAVFLGWKDSEGNELPEGFDSIRGCRVFYADLDTGMHSVTVYTEPGIDGVSIDGHLLVNTGGNTFLMTGGEKLEPGTHTVSCLIENGCCGDIRLPMDGKPLNGMEFELTSGKEKDHVLNLTGVRAEEEPAPVVVPVQPETPVIVTVTEDGGLGLAEYLLITIAMMTATILIIAV